MLSTVSSADLLGGLAIPGPQTLHGLHNIHALSPCRRPRACHAPTRPEARGPSPASSLFTGKCLTPLLCRSPKVRARGLSEPQPHPSCEALGSGRDRRGRKSLMNTVTEKATVTVPSLRSHPREHGSVPTQCRLWGVSTFPFLPVPSTKTSSPQLQLTCPSYFISTAVKYIEYKIYRLSHF